MRKREILDKINGIVKFILFLSKFIPKSIHKFNLKLFRNFDNYLGMFIRYLCVKNLSKECGKNVAIFSGVYLLNLENLIIGNNVSIHPMCYIDGKGQIDIGDDVSIAHGTSILSNEHIFDSVEINTKDQGCIGKKTVIENNVWIGAGVRVLAGAYIKNGAIVAAGAVVKGNVEKNTIVGGVPARVIKRR